MPKAIDWDALAAVFTPPQPNTEEEDAVSRASSDTVTYNGAKMPRWLARDLMRERAAIREYDGGMSRVEAEACVKLVHTSQSC